MTTLETALAAAFDALRAEIHTALPGRVEKYDAAKQTADVLPMVRLQGHALPVLPSVPVAFARGGGGFLSFPLEPGDFVFLLFAESSIDQWRAKGASTDPGDPRRHSLTAAVALPCLYPTARALADASATKIVLGFDGGYQLTIDKDNGFTLATGAAGDQLVSKNDLETRLNELKAAIQAGLTAGGGAGPSYAGGATQKTAFDGVLAASPTWPNPLASGLVGSD